MTNEIIGMILSIIGMVITVISFQMKEKGNLLILQSAGTVFYLVSYIFAEGGVAVWLNCIFLIRNFTYMNIDKCRRQIRFLACGLLCLGCIAVLAGFILTTDLSFCDYLWSSLPIIGGIFGTIAVVNTNVNRLRVLKLGDSISWLSYNIHIGIGALGGIIGEVLNISSIALALIRFSKKK